MILAFGCLPVLAGAQELEPPEVSYPQLPAHAASAELFAPKGWSIESKIAGDLNGDGISDLALVLRQHDQKNVLDNKDGLGVDKLDTNPRILAVAIGSPNGGYDLVSSNHTLIPRATDPSFDDFFDGIAVAHRTLQVKLRLFANAGGWTAGNITYTLRLRHGRFELIGYDSSMAERNTGKTDTISIDYATGKMKHSTGTIESDAEKVRWQSLPAQPLLTIDQIGNGIEFDPAHHS